MSSNQIRSLVAILIITATVMAGHLLPGLDNSRVEEGVRNGFHVLVFASVAVIFLEVLIASGLSPGRAVIATIVAVAAIGGLSETLQFLSGRQPDILDVIRDLSGAALALSGRVVWQRSSEFRRSRSAKLALRALSVTISFCVLVPLVYWLSIFGIGRMASPVILDFTHWWSQYLYRPVNAEIVSSPHVPGAMEVQLQKRGRSGLVISPMTTDWRQFEFLTISAGMAKGPDTNVTVRLNDSDHRGVWSDEHSISIVVPVEFSEIRIPIRGAIDNPGHPSMDLSDIQEIVIFARDRRRGTVMLVSEIGLE